MNEKNEMHEMNDTDAATPTPTSATAPATATAPIPARRPGRSTTIGVAAGLLAGGAIGLAASAPSLTSAAADDGAEAVVELQEDTTDEQVTEETADGATSEPGDRLRESLQALVDDGTITATQADAVTAHLTEHVMENRPERGEGTGRLGPGGHGRNHTVLADVLGIDRETLRTELAAGKSIADIAEANGVDIQVVIDTLIADVESHLELAVEHGLDEERAETRLERLTERIEERVYDTRGAAG